MDSITIIVEMKNKDKNKVPWEMSEKDKHKEMRKWMQDPEVIYFSSEDQKEVVLNSGQKQEIFNKTYPVIGKVILHKMHYIEDLPKNCKGKIIAVTAIQPKDRQGNPKGKLVPKPIGKFWELFESSSGSRYWINPVEYQNVYNRKTRRKNKKVPRTFKTMSARIGDDETNKQILRRLKGRNSTENSSTTGAKSKGRNTRKRNQRFTRNSK